MIIDFEIDHLDPLGQGVSKIADKIAFIPKTLPGEKGTAEVIKKSKGVYFAKLIELTLQSAERTPPSCPHYQQCNGCQYLHTSYPQELQHKENALRRALQGLKESHSYSLEIVQAPSRTHYRNRVQLHYQSKRKLIGQKLASSQNILPTPECQLPRKELLPHLEDLYRHRLPQRPSHGHIELYLQDGEVQTTLNSNYAHGGFTQVYPEMNKVMVGHVLDFLNQTQTHQGVLDLFGGGGNFTRGVHYPAYVIDQYPNQRSPMISGHQSFKSIDLYGESSLDECIQWVSPHLVDLLLIDPPRSGFKQLPEWAQAYQPQNIVYISCKASTLVRDLRDISPNYSIDKVQLFDLFPSTQHFETVVYLSRHSKKA